MISKHSISLLLLLFLVVGFAKAQITSGFNSNTESWTAPQSAGNIINHSPTGGNPGGFVSATPTWAGVAAIIPVYFYFTAPSAFLGNRSSYYNGNIIFDLRQGTFTTAVARAEVIISNGGTRLFYFPPTPFNPPTASWTTYPVPLSATSGNWKTVNSGTGPSASQAQIQAVLSNLTAVEIRGRFNAIAPASPGLTSLDNVVMQPPITVITQPVSQTSCAGANVVLSTAATGNSNLTYQWQLFNVSTGLGADLNNNAVYSGVTTNMMTINTSTLLGTLTYRCVVSGTNATDAFTNIATVNINSLPVAPSAIGAAICGTSSLSLNATGGSPGQYRWYTVPTGGTAISLETSSTYSTPVISTTTNYYVSINNGTCESVRALATATINSIPTQPTTTPASNCTPLAIMLSASGGSAGDYRWYDVPSGGIPISGETNASFTTPVLANTATYYVSITNGLCESARTPVTATIGGVACTNVPPAITPSTTTTSIAGMATFDLISLINDADDNLDPTTLKIVLPPISDASAIISNGTLTIDYSGLSFAGTDRLTIEVCDVLGSCAQQELTVEVEGDVNVYNGISPNGDLQNEIWVIQNIESLPDTRENKVTIFNRWGDLVFEIENYDNGNNVFSGVSSKGDKVPSGIYFYKIEFIGQRETISGYLNVVR